MKTKILLSAMTALIITASVPAFAADDVSSQAQEAAPEDAPMQPPMMPGMMMHPGANGNQAMPMPPMMPIDVPACNALHAEVQALTAEIKTLSEKIDRLEKASKK